MGDRSMSSLRNWGFGSAVTALILLGPIIAFLVVIGAEMLCDVVATRGVKAVSVVSAAAIGWGLLRPFRPQSNRHQLGSEEA
jgi:hypothetical protein